MIDYEITGKNYERIRDKVGAILKSELANQAATYYNTHAEDVRIFVERYIPLDAKDIRTIILSMSEGTFDNHHPEGMDGTYRIPIEIYVNQKQTGTGDDHRPDALAAYKLQKLMALVIAILQNPIYKTLGFAPGFIHRVRVMAFKTGQVKDPKANQLDALNHVIGLLMLEVKATESVELPDAEVIEVSNTVVTLLPGDKGLEFQITF